jgi:DNA-binding response OmpR family regulator
MRLHKTPIDNETMPRPKILLVDDAPDFLRALRLRLRANNYEVATACDGYTAIASAQNERPALIILDLGLPWRRRIRRPWPVTEH